jgi:rubrerythrin
MAGMLKRQPELLSAIINHAPAKRNRTNVGLRSSVNSKSVCTNREVPRNRRSRKGANSVPYPQRDRIKRKFIGGKNISQIAREESRHWDTVARIVKEEDVQEYVKDVRARFYGALEELLLAAVEYAKYAKDGGWLAYEMLKDGGVIPQDGKSHHPAWGIQPLTPEKEEYATRKIAVAMADGIIERYKSFGLPLPDMEEVSTDLCRQCAGR